jgi:hypothetical protein
MNDYDEAVLFTYSLLETRLARLEYLLSGATSQSNESKPQPIPERIHAIEQSLTRLAGQTALLDNVNELRMSIPTAFPGTTPADCTVSKHRDVLIPSSTTSTPAALTSAQKSTIVIDRATSLSTVASQLSSLHDSQMPSTDGFVKLASLRPRIAEAEMRQLQQALKIAELRRRSGMVVQRDRQVLGVAGGKAWVDGQQRLVRGWRGLAGEERRRAEGREEDAAE